MGTDAGGRNARRCRRNEVVLAGRHRWDLLLGWCLVGLHRCWMGMDLLHRFAHFQWRVLQKKKYAETW